MRRTQKKNQKSDRAFHTKHALGQNFITDESRLNELADLSGVTHEDTVLEIGPGMGTLTKALSDRAARVLAIEYDETLRPYLEVRLHGCNNVQVLYADALRVPLKQTLKETFGTISDLRVCANLPYYITSELIAKLTRELPEACSMAFMVQQEVAEKMLAAPGNEGYGPLALTLQWHYDLNIAKEVPRECFEPQPKVDSAFVVLRRRKTAPYPVRDDAKLERFIRGSFAMRRKTLMNNLGGLGIPREKCRTCLQSLGLPESVRAEELGLRDFCVLCDELMEN